MFIVDDGLLDDRDEVPVPVPVVDELLILLMTLFVLFKRLLRGPLGRVESMKDFSNCQIVGRCSKLSR